MERYIKNTVFLVGSKVLHIFLCSGVCGAQVERYLFSSLVLRLPSYKTRMYAVCSEVRQISHALCTVINGIKIKPVPQRITVNQTPVTNLTHCRKRLHCRLSTMYQKILQATKTADLSENIVPRERARSLSEERIYKMKVILIAAGGKNTQTSFRPCNAEVFSVCDYISYLVINQWKDSGGTSTCGN